jgi:hypothetical protein
MSRQTNRMGRATSGAGPQLSFLANNQICPTHVHTRGTQRPWQCECKHPLHVPPRWSPDRSPRCERDGRAQTRCAGDMRIDWRCVGVCAVGTDSVGVASGNSTFVLDLRQPPTHTHTDSHSLPAEQEAERVAHGAATSSGPTSTESS